MAGSYSDVPGHRMPYDRDGSIVTFVSDALGTSTPLTTAEMQNINDEDGGSAAGEPYEVKWKGHETNDFPYRLTFIFPEPRDLVGYGIWPRLDSRSPSTYWTSTNTTNGVDGTWTSRGTWVQDVRTGLRAARTVNFPGIVGIKFAIVGSGSGWQSIYAAHMFGSPASGQAPNRLRFWHPTLDQEVGGAHFDWGDVARNTVLTKTFRVKNPSATLTAFSTSLTREAFTDSSGINVAAHEFSFDDVTYTSTLNLGDLSPGEISPVIYVRRATLASNPISLWDVRFIASAASYA